MAQPFSRLVINYTYGTRQTVTHLVHLRTVEKQ